MNHEDYSLVSIIKRFGNKCETEISESNFSLNSHLNNSQEPRKPKAAFPNINYLKEQNQSPRGHSVKNGIEQDFPLTLNNPQPGRYTVAKKPKVEKNYKENPNQKSKVTRIIKCDLVREPRGREEVFVRGRGKFSREASANPVIKSISDFDYNNPLTERNCKNRGRSEGPRRSTETNILFKLGNLDDALKKAQNLLDNKPKDENYLYLKGRVLEKLEREKEAEYCFKEALDINPKFSQAAFYLAAIENKRGNFEKSIELYNYALSKDQIPIGNHKITTPFVSVDIGVASDNTIKANISGSKQQLKSTLKPLSTLRKENTLNSSEKSTKVASTIKEKKMKRHKRISHPDPKILKSGGKMKNFSPKNTTKAYTMENSPAIEQKKLRKAWRMTKNRTHKKKISCGNSKDYPAAFYSLGNSLNKAETISASSGNPFTSNLQSSQDEKNSLPTNLEAISKICKSTKKKKKAKKLNFSDRMLSSKLYSIKRQEIFLYNKKANQKGISKTQNQSCNTSRVRKTKPGTIPRTCFNSANKSRHGKRPGKSQYSASKPTKTSKSSWNCMKNKMKATARVNLSDSSSILIDHGDRSNRDIRAFMTHREPRKSNNRKLNQRYDTSASKNGSEIDPSDTFALIQKHLKTDSKYGNSKPQTTAENFVSRMSNSNNNESQSKPSQDNFSGSQLCKVQRNPKIVGSHQVSLNRGVGIGSDSYTRNTDMEFSKVLNTGTSDNSSYSNAYAKRVDELIKSTKSYSNSKNPFHLLYSRTNKILCRDSYITKTKEAEGSNLL
ncbi:unnamed protein product [Moneuplotes crassus]|uniref:Uncharacterized protein n=1 Tax=Euplotes crassus TaxID=5936 RepID=A0AAD1Y3G7_EUPCR|nr:unnamed protein product [Moneuplotes crassus]